MTSEESLQEKIARLEKEKAELENEKLTLQEKLQTLEKTKVKRVLTNDEIAKYEAPNFMAVITPITLNYLMKLLNEYFEIDLKIANEIFTKITTNTEIFNISKQYKEKHYTLITNLNEVFCLITPNEKIHCNSLSQAASKVTGAPASGKAFWLT
jgi:hypothetical protein